MKYFSSIVPIMLIILGCASSTTQRSISMESKTGARIILDSGLSRGEMVAWLTYGSVRAQWMDEKFFEIFPSDSEYRYTFEEEYEARCKMVEVWSKQKVRMLYGNNAYLDDVSSILKKGFLKEYVWQYYRYNEWEEPTGLRESEFKLWFSQKHEDHSLMTRAKIFKKEDIKE